MPDAKTVTKEGRPKLSLGQQKRMLLSRIPEKMRTSFDRTATAISTLVSGEITPGRNIYLLDFDFVPIPPSPTSSQVGMSGYDINWPGPPRHNLGWSDVRFYKSLISIKDPAPLDVTFYFWVYEDVSMWSDTYLATFYATIRRGSSTPADSDIVCISSAGENAPSNAPYQSTGAFWLGATKQGKIRGNAGKNDRTADVYLAASDLISFPSGGSCDWDRAREESRRHTVRAH